MQKVLVTGAAGFIGAHAAAALKRLGLEVVGCDSFNAYYPPALKHDRVRALLGPHGVPCHRLDLADVAATRDLLQRGGFDTVLHLAAQAGVRHSIEAPMDYVQANLVGFTALLQACHETGVEHFFYASSSSVYGSRTHTPFREDDRTDQPASLYAASKKANELIASSYASVHGLRSTALRFFTVYGPWGRPDMAYFSFARRLRCGEPITLFAGGTLWRDFTYIDDAVDAVVRLMQAHGLEAPAPLPAPASPIAVAEGLPHPLAEVFNIGHHEPVQVLDFVRDLEAATGCTARVVMAPMQPGDVPMTCADPQRLLARIGPWPHTPLRDGLQRFADWLNQWEPVAP
jgi:UDP-glucuronate 4-epimerase